MKLKPLSLKSTSVVLLGGAALGTWFAGACGAIGEDETPDVAAVQGPLAAAQSDEIDHVPQGYARVPGGRLVHRDCLHEVPDGAEVGEDLSVTLKGRKIAQYARCSHPNYRFKAGGQGAVTAGAPTPATGSGWVEASWGTTTSKMFTHMDSGGWVVPPAPPTSGGQTIFFFPSFESFTTGGAAEGIVQPVLQWGPSAAGGGTFWAMANWILSPGATFFSTLHRVNVGDTVSGVMDLVNNTTTSQTWKVSYSSPGFTSSLQKATTDGRPFTAAQAGVLEAYGVSFCSHFPGGPAGQNYFSTYFSRPRIFQGNSYADRNAVNPAWTLFGPSSFGWTGPTNCAFGSSTVSSNGDTTLWY